MRRDPSTRRNHTEIMVTVSVKNVEEDPTLTLRPSPGAGPRRGWHFGIHRNRRSLMTLTTEMTQGPITITPTYRWYVPKVNRPVLDNEDHWTDAPGGANSGTTLNDFLHSGTQDEVDKYLRVVATYVDGAGSGNDKAYARSAYPVGAARAPGPPNNNPTPVPQWHARLRSTLREDAPVGTVVGTVRGSDVDYQ